ncbi:MAG: hypothetical protein K2N60_01900 [Oscillospiraceae bacterium]|nr:hypothetical protein [Oscillospiraceae bacterium]
MEIKNFFKDNGFCIICMVVCFGLGFVFGALLAPHHNKLEFNLFSGNGNSNRDNSANFGSGGVQNGQKRRKNKE